MKECQDQKVDMKKLEAIHKIKADQWFKYSANINLEEELIENLNPNDVDINALFEVVVTSFNKNPNPH